jgi:hypothetical protein
MEKIYWPKHKTSLFLSHNMHKEYNISIAEYIANAKLEDEDWISPNEKQSAIDSDSLWRLSWDSDTSLRWCTIHAASFEALTIWMEENKEVLQWGESDDL